jgi:hypothetical protein
VTDAATALWDPRAPALTAWRVAAAPGATVARYTGQTSFSCVPSLIVAW